MYLSCDQQKEREGYQSDEILVLLLVARVKSDEKEK